ncbi:MAG: AmmeMemoRadiSam system protein B [bacterium]
MRARAKRLALISFASLAVVLAISAILLVYRRGKPEGVVEKPPAVAPICPPAVAGTFYPGEREALIREVDGLLRGAQRKNVPGNLVALISPHAGYTFSGGVAASAYKQLEGREFEAVILVGPSHRVYFRGCSVYWRGGYETPLGVVEVDSDLARAIVEGGDSIRYVQEAHEGEHSLEVQLPFLQRVLGDFKIVPIVMGDQSWESCVALSDAISRAALGRKVLLVASSDLSHYHPYDEARRLDGLVIERVRRCDPKGLSDDLAEGKCEACGGGPIVAVMLAAQNLGANSAEILDYATSGDITGDKRAVVGYMAAALYNRGGSFARTLGPEERKELLTIARKAIECCIRGKPIPQFDVTSPLLKERGAAFVTLREDGHLRGCIGCLLPVKPLYETVSEMAVSAAFRDPRFPPLSPGELERVDLEISVLTPLRRIEDVREIQVGTHGIFIRKGRSSGLLLPQVAVEYGWDREEFLVQACRKADLPPDAWRDGAEIFVFSVQVFGEKEMGVRWGS